MATSSDKSNQGRKASISALLSRGNRTTLSSIPEAAPMVRRPSGGVTLLNNADGGIKAQRTSKTSQKLVVLPSEPQTKPILGELVDEASETLVTTKGTQEYKSEGERMTKSERERAGFKRLTAYCVSESLRMKLLAAFLKREHNVAPRVYDEALYVMYHLPLLPGYDPSVNVRSSVASKSPNGKSFLRRLSEAEENGYEGTYFISEDGEDSFSTDGFIVSSSPFETRTSNEPGEQQQPRRRTRAKSVTDEKIAEVIFFSYGVIVFFGLREPQERAIIEDINTAGILTRKFGEDAWEVEECHFVYDPNTAYQRIYNDLFTFKSSSHLLKLSIAHALAQSTLLARYESKAQGVLSDPQTTKIPRMLASTGELKLRRRDALRLTGRLFQLRRDVNLVSNVLDVPELFWSEASLKDLYDAVREYMEIGPRVHVLNEKLAVANDLLDLIHGHLNNSAMERITWIIIWLIVVACLVEFGEVLARLIVNSTEKRKDANFPPVDLPISRDTAMAVLERIMQGSKL